MSTSPRYTCRKRPGLAVAAVACCLAVPLRAQVLEEVVVTAQKRVESLQDVPLTVTVVDGKTLQQFAINNVTDLANSVPGLAFEPAPQGLPIPNIRGLGTGTADENLEQSVGLFIDGVWTGKTRNLLSSLFDVDRIEVIKGAQTSQLGKNTSLGAILVNTMRPQDASDGYLEGEYDFEFESSILQGVGNLATEAGKYRLAVNLIDEKGYVENELAGGHDPHREQNSVRLSGLWDLGQWTTVFATYTYDELEVTGMAFQVSDDPNGWYQGVTGDSDTHLNAKSKTWNTYAGDGRDYDKQETNWAVVEVAHELTADTQLMSLSGYNSYDNKPRYYDADFSALQWLQQYKKSHFRQFSQEFRVTGTALGQALDYVAGAYYLANSFENYAQTDFLSNPGYLDLPDPVPDGLVAATGPASGYGSYHQDVDSWSVFGNGAYQLAENWRLTLGIRYTDETQKLKDWESVTTQDETNFYFDLGNGTYVGPIVPPEGPATFYEVISPDFYARKLSRSEDNVDGSVNLQYDFGDTGNAYVSWARGSKSGGFPTSATPDTEQIDTEQAETSEAGVKLNLLGGGLRVSAAAFFTRIDDFQSVVFVGDGFASESIPVESQGVEFDSMWAATDKLVLGLAVTYADAQRTDTNVTPSGSPEWAASFSAAYTLALGANYRLRSNAAVNYRDGMYTQTDETYRAPAITLVDLRVALAPRSENWELALMARNLFDEQELAFGFGLPVYGADYASIGSLNRPRTVAMQARYNF